MSNAGAPDRTQNGSKAVIDLRYRPPSLAPLTAVRIVDKMPWGGPSYSFLGKRALIVGMEARISPISDPKYGNDNWDYKLEIEDGGPPVWLPSSCLTAAEND